ncbi:MAG TPA: hypothetical protein GYA08_03625 [Chloroflexi bacterium]|nr:hypothetical protein [Chloroflexota bacterium]
MKSTISKPNDEQGVCCCICKGMGICYLLCLVSPLVLAAGVAVVALISFFG